MSAYITPTQPGTYLAFDPIKKKYITIDVYLGPANVGLWVWYEDLGLSQPPECYHLDDKHEGHINITDCNLGFIHLCEPSELALLFY